LSSELTQPNPEPQAQLDLPPAIEAIDGVLLVHPDSVGKNISLIRWFVPMAIGLAMLFVLMRTDLFGLGAGPLGFRVRLVMFLMLYLSLACTFIPLPTTPVICWAATATLAFGEGRWGNLPGRILKAIMGIWIDKTPLADEAMARVLLIAALGALATTVANLNEYHILTAILRHRKVAAVRNTRLYRAAIRWFNWAPWATICAFSMLPLPVDAVRLLSITFRYPRWRFVTAGYVGRFVRYFLLAFVVAKLDSQPAEQWFVVLGITALVVGLGLTVGLRQLIRLGRSRG
jgi:membrane protein YqaA with SNARE-associated domain